MLIGSLDSGKAMAARPDVMEQSLKSHGRGGIFAGGAAQIQLMPTATNSSHPTTGQAGDFYVDASNSLWFCKGGTKWVKLA